MELVRWLMFAALIVLAIYAAGELGDLLTNVTYDFVQKLP